MFTYRSLDDSDDGSEFGDEGIHALGHLSEDPKTMSEIKRSRIDLGRRYAFLCPTSLSKHFDVIPHQVKDTALLVFKCSKEWLIPEPNSRRFSSDDSGAQGGGSKTSRKAKALKSSKESFRKKFRSNSGFSKEFLQWVMVKEKEQSIFWWKPEKSLKKLSEFIEAKVDPVSDELYQPLLLDPHWWRVTFQRTTARYCSNPAIIGASISERSNAGIDKRDIPLPVLQELLYQSNPMLEPVSKWPYAPSMRFLPRAQNHTKGFVGQYASFKGYVDRSRLAESSSQDQARVSQWPSTARERLDDLHQAWHLDDVLARRTLPAVSSPRPSTGFKDGGGLFGSKLGFGQGLQAGARVRTADPTVSRRSQSFLESIYTPPGSSSGVRMAPLSAR